MAQGDSHQVLRPSSMDDCIIVSGFDPIDLVSLNERQGPTRPHDQPLETCEPVPSPVRLGIRREPLLLDPPLGAMQRPLEPLVAERLEQVIDGAGFEGLDRVAVIGGKEHGDRYALLAMGLDQLEARHAGHLDVDQHEVEVAGFELAQRVRGPRAGADLSDLGVVRQHATNAIAGHGLVIDHENAKVRRRSHRTSGVPLARTGTSIDTLRPRSAPRARWNWASSPYTWRKRSRVLRKPRPVDCPGDHPGGRPGPSSSTVSASRFMTPRARMLRWNGPSHALAPWRIAFSTRGCSSRLGTLARRTSGSASTSTWRRSENRMLSMSR